MSYILRTVGADESATENIATVPDEASARGAWLEAIRGGTVRYAGVTRTDGPKADRFRCAWDACGAFTDRTEAHREELRALCAELSADAPAARKVEVDGATVLYSRKPLDGCTHRIQVNVSSMERVLAHWKGWLP